MSELVFEPFDVSNSPPELLNDYLRILSASNSDDGNEKPNPEEWHRPLDLADQESFAVNYQNGDVVAVYILDSSYFRDKDEFWINNIAVREGFRSQKIGSRIISRVFDLAENGAYLRVKAAARSDPDTLRFYKQNGFEIISTNSLYTTVGRDIR